MRFVTVALLGSTLMPAALADERLADDPGVAQALRRHSLSWPRID